MTNHVLALVSLLWPMGNFPAPRSQRKRMKLTKILMLKNITRTITQMRNPGAMAMEATYSTSTLTTMIFENTLLIHSALILEIDNIRNHFSVPSNIRMIHKLLH
ncbi:hypothetical protein EDC04DRAFT_903720 [Pisolithus marmoratus]|nr:hypothetical protein EDC04DRAFT_903720 [Pisolithus marmoratus]